MILTDANYNVMMLLRHAKMEDEDDEKMTLTVGSAYPVEKSRKLSLLSQGLDRSIIESEDETAIFEHVASQVNFRASQLRLHEAIMHMTTFCHPLLAKHACVIAGLEASKQYKKDLSFKEESDYLSYKDTDGNCLPLIDLARALKEALRVYDVVAQMGGKEGYLTVTQTANHALPLETEKNDPSETQTALSRRILDNGGWSVEEFSPIVLERVRGLEEEVNKKGKKKSTPTASVVGELKFDSFSQAVDVFFATVEKQKFERQLETKNASADSRVEKIRSDQERRVAELAEVQRLSEKQAELIESNVHLVDNLINLMKDLLASNDWQTTQQIVIEAAREGHPLAIRITNFNFENNKFSVLLGETFGDDEDGDDDGEFDGSELLVQVELDYTLNAYQNIAEHHASRKLGKVKLAKTEWAASKAIKDAESKAEAEKQKESLKIAKAQILERRKVFWFEKFRWFVSSENFLVLAGRDAQQNDILFKRYLEKNDIYVHADVVGAATCIIKNPKNLPEIPPRTLLEAGQFSVCHSSAWTVKRPAPAYWVRAEQVSKTAPTGEYLTQGAFMIRGKKNYLPVCNLEMGLAIMFHLGADSLARHQGERERGVSGETEGDEMANVGKYNKDGRRVRDEEDSEGEKQEEKTGEDVGDFEFINNDGASKEDKKKETEKKKGKNVAQGAKDKNKEGKDHKKERKDHNNAKLRGEANGDESQEEDDDVDRYDKFKTQRKESDDSKEKNTKAAALAQLPRGQRSKLKKIEKKYKDQDEEDREMMLALLGGKKMKRQDVVLEREGEGDSSAEEEEQTQEAQKRVEEEQERQREEEENEKRRQQNREKRERREVRALGLEDEEVAAEIQMKLKEIDQLTFSPAVEDSLLCAVPVCAPYLSLNHAMFKVKLVPGTEKKGRALQSAVKLILMGKNGVSLNTNGLNAAENELTEKGKKHGATTGTQVNVPAACLELIRHLDVDAAQHCMISDLKIAAAGVVQVKLQDKKEKKDAAKNKNSSCNKK
eukprot:GDKJ01006421.1.p1 GENE.GDKJ01006421.1~~GDKJ01006421.1.p1  ORF type:complete len:1132 (-),score=369.12 GDKJ01006421.1:164-3178(-)